MRLVLALPEEDPGVMGAEGEGPISVEGAVIKIGQKFQNGALFVIASYFKKVCVQSHFSSLKQP
jgi:hypothetical protein